MASHDHLKNSHGNQMSRSWSDGLALGDQNVPVKNDGKGGVGELQKEEAIIEISNKLKLYHYQQNFVECGCCESKHS
eukprot:1344046-Ditylum_brightwellii.AAC.1